MIRVKEVVARDGDVLRRSMVMIEARYFKQFNVRLLS